VIATHEEYPIERMSLDRRAKWLGSVSHDECIKLTDVENMLEDSDDEGEEGEDEDEEMGDGVSKEEGDEAESVEEDGSDEEEEEEDSDSDVDMDDSKRSKKEGGKSGMGDMGRTHRNAEEGGFFDDL
jgi:hypothetical protein